MKIVFKYSLILFLIFFATSSFALDEFSGIGVKVNKDGDKVIIEDVIENYSAYRFGITKGDRILKINNEDVSKCCIHEVLEKLRGEDNTEIKLEIFNHNTGKTDNYTLPRDYNNDRFIITNNINKMLRKKQYRDLLEYTEYGLNQPEILNDAVVMSYIFMAKGIANFNMQNYTAAIQNFNTSMEKLPNYYPLVGLGNCALAYKQYSVAKEYYEQSIQYRAHNPEAYEGLANVYKGMNNPANYYKNLTIAKNQYLRDSNMKKYRDIARQLQ